MHPYLADEDDADDGLLEVRFVPDAPEHLESMFKAMNECQLLHPDPDDSVSEEEEGEREEEASAGDDEGDECDEARAERMHVFSHGNGSSPVDEDMEVQSEDDD